MRDDVSKSMALHSGEYVKKYANKPVTRVANLVAKMIIGPNDIIADYACGNGMLLEVLPTARGSYHGVDFSKDFIDSANRRATENGSENYSFHCQDITEFTATRENRFDISATLDFSEHISDRMFVEIYSAIRSSMKPGAKLYIHTPNLNFLLNV